MKKITRCLILTVCLLSLTDCSSLKKSQQETRFSHSLNWGTNPLTKKSWTKKDLQENFLVRKELKNIINSADKDLKNENSIMAIDRIEKEGTLNSDIRHSASDQALSGTESILKWAICSLTAESSIGQRCFKAAYTGVMKWVNLYQPTGNPINDSHLLRLLLSIDLILNQIDVEDQEVVKNWVKTFIINGDKFFENLHDGFKMNNWMTWRLAIRSLSGTILQDNKIISETKILINEHSKANLNPPVHWKPIQSCANNKNEFRYGGYDFRKRDALHYHVYNLEAWAWMALFTPELLDSETIQSINTAFDFLRPYFLQQKTHTEFVCSEVKFDIQRKKSGQFEFENKNWDPFRARKLLRMARSVKFLTIQEWSKTVVDENYQPWIKFLSATQGQSE